MSKLHQSHGRADADTARGELRKPDDQSDQPGQGGNPSQPLSQLHSVYTEQHEPSARASDDTPASRRDEHKGED